MKLKHIKKQLGICVALALSSSPALAYKYLYDTCGSVQVWPTTSMTFNANPTGFSGTYSKWLTSFNVALTRVNDTPANFNMYVRLDNDYDVAIGNGESEVWWASGVSAVEYTTTSSCGVTVETDIVMHNDIPGGYSDDMNVKTNFRGYGLEKRTFESTAIHEAGHALGLGHENRYYNIMGNDYTHLHTVGETSLKSYVGEDATTALISLYGSSTREDVSVAAWRRTGASGEYSTHSRNRLLNSSGVVLSSTKVESSCTREYCEMRHDVALGQPIQFEMTLENNGRNSQSVELGYYISTNASITNQDTRIGSDVVTVTRNTPDTVIRNVTIPANLLPNTNYYLGVIIDNSNLVTEWDEANNTSYIHIRTGAGSTNPSAPRAEANGPYSGAVNSAISLSSAGSVDSDGTISSYSWNFGDGSTSTVANPSKTYSAAGTYNVTLTVTDNSGLTGTDTATVNVGSVPPPSTLENACLTEGPTTGNALTNRDAVCVPDGSATNSIQYYYIYVPSGTTSMKIESAHGTGNGDLYYNASAWATSSAYSLSSTGPSNTESITVSNPGSGYRYVSVVGARAGMALKVTLQ